MKYLLILIACLPLALACSRARTPERTVEPADKLDCENVYTYIVTLQANSLSFDHSLSSKENEGLRWELEQENEQNGSKERFLRTCMATMTKAQVDCMLHVNTIDELHTCSTLVR